MKWLIGAGFILLTIAGMFWSLDRYISGPRIAGTPEASSLAPVFPPGLEPSGVTAATEYANEIGAASVIVIRDGALLLELGETSRKISAHSVRKSIVSALYGIAVDRNLIDIQATLESLGVNDDPPLSEGEKSARLEHLLTSRSGIYHASVRDDGERYPEPGSHAPNEAFFYNNWGFNALGGIFEEQTGLSLGQAFEEWIAGPTDMMDFLPSDVRYESGPESRFPAYRFWLSARDMARFGQLYLDEGRWRGQQVMPAQWIESSLKEHTQNLDGAGYGYMWWIMPDNSYLATGTGGQKIRLFPASRTLLVTRVDTGEGITRGVWWNFGKRIGNRQTLELLRRLDGADEHVGT